MDDIQKEAQQEEELLNTPSKEDEVRAKIIEKYGLDEIDNAELIDRLTKDRLEDQKNFGELVKQKRNWREKAQAQKPPEPPKQEPQKPLAVDEDQLMKLWDQRQAEREFQSLNIPDDIKAEAKRLKPEGVSYQQFITTDPYIKFKLDQAAVEGKFNEAAISPTYRAAPRTEAASFSEKTKSIDVNTEEGRKQWLEEHQKAKIPQFIPKE